MDASASANADREENTPFLLRVFYRTGAFHRPDEFASHTLPPHIAIHTWPSCSLAELTHHLAASTPSLLPSPAIGTRLAFRLIYPDTRPGSAPARPAASAPPRFVAKDLGSVVIGAAEDEDNDANASVNTNNTNNNGVEVPAAAEERHKTLGDAKFIVGDFLSCAILPPAAGTGVVAPPSSARTGRGAGPGEGRGAIGGPPVRRDREGENGPGRPSRRGGRGGPGFHDFGGGGVPMGEWRRGERLPDEPAGRPRGRNGRY